MTITPQPDADLTTMMHKVFADLPEVDERTTDVDLDRTAWATLRDLGLTGMMSEQGATWVDTVALLRAAAAHHVSVPLVEHDVLAQWLRQLAGLPLSSEPSTACLVTHGGAVNVPWASQVDRLVVLSSLHGIVRVTDLPASSLEIAPARGAAGLPEDLVTVPLEALDGPHVEPAHLDELRVRDALARSAQMTGAMQAAVELSRDYALQRQQFGRPIAQFQAVQHLFVEAAAECALSVAAVDTAAAAAELEGTGSPRVHDLVSAAVSVCTHAATVVSRNAHQIHGAIGTTLEYPLHRLTRPLWAWRSGLGGPLPWERDLATRLIDDPTPLWFQVTR